MRQTVALLSLGAALMVPGVVSPEDHLVTPDSARQQLLAAEAERQHDLAVVERALSSPPAVQAAARVGADLERVRATLPTLSDEELADLATRAAALQGDPVAGLDQDIKTLLEIFLIVAIVILVLRNV